MNQPLISAQWLHENLNHPDLILLDVSTPNNVSGAKTEFQGQKIPHTRFFDLKNNFSDTESRFPNTFPSVRQFEQQSRLLGISNSSKIVVYDNLGIYLSPRVWWMFRTMGHQEVYVLNGGLPEWIANGFETVDRYETPEKEGNFTSTFDPDQVKGIDFIQSNLTTQKYLVVDARSEDRFYARVKEPREGLRSGHIPSALNIPYEMVLDHGKFKSVEDLQKVFEHAGVDERPLAFSCGSGVTACILLLAAELALNNKTSIYDGSWTEYGSLIPDNPDSEMHVSE